MKPSNPEPEPEPEMFDPYPDETSSRSALPPDNPLTHLRYGILSELIQPHIINIRRLKHSINESVYEIITQDIKKNRVINGSSYQIYVNLINDEVYLNEYIDNGFSSGVKNLLLNAFEHAFTDSEYELYEDSEIGDILSDIQANPELTVECFDSMLSYMLENKNSFGKNHTITEIHEIFDLFLKLFVLDSPETKEYAETHFEPLPAPFGIDESGLELAPHGLTGEGRPRWGRGRYADDAAEDRDMREQMSDFEDDY